jgi:hypothetical protein
VAQRRAEASATICQGVHAEEEGGSDVRL